MTKRNGKHMIALLVFSFIMMFSCFSVVQAACFAHTYRAATCTQPKICTACGHRSGSALGHHYVVSGNTATCTRCGNSKVVGGGTGGSGTGGSGTGNSGTGNSGTGSGHTHVYYSATCTSPRTCKTCGYEDGNPLGHNYYTSETPATCTTAGYITKTCRRCGDTNTQTTSALGHDYITKGTDATCTTSGSIVKTCRRCGDTKAQTVPALGHDYITKGTDATCTTSGSIAKTCRRCGDTKTQIIPALGHDYVIKTTEATCTTPGRTVKTCRRCGDTITTQNDALGHNYKETSKVEATCTESGKIVSTCTRCGDTKTQTIPALGHDKVMVFDDTHHWYECDRCGERLEDKEKHKFDEDDTCTVCGFHKKGGSDDPEDPDDPDKNDGDLIVEPWMKENDELNCLAVSLRSEPYEEDRANKNIYALDEKVIYYVDYKNGGKATDKEVTLKLTLPLAFSVVNSDGATVSRSKKTFTWTLDGLEKDECGTKVVVIKYTSLGSSSLTFKRVEPKATISLVKSEKDVSAVLNMVVRELDEEIEDEHDPYMFGDEDTGRFRPDYTITRAEGALVLTRIFGISTRYDENTYAFPDLDETYLEARRAIIAATAHGIIEGYPDGTYRPNQKMTRGEFITILAREIEEEYGEGFEVKDIDELIKVYKDRNRIYHISNNEYYDAHWSVPYATLLARLNMTPLREGMTNLKVSDPITRAEVAQLVNFYLLRAPAKVSSTVSIGFPDVSKRHTLIGDIIEATRKTHTYEINDEGEEVARF